MAADHNHQQAQIPAAIPEAEPRPVICRLVLDQKQFYHWISHPSGPGLLILGSLLGRFASRQQCSGTSAYRRAYRFPSVSSCSPELVCPKEPRPLSASPLPLAFVWPLPSITNLPGSILPAESCISSSPEGLGWASCHILLTIYADNCRPFSHKKWENGPEIGELASFPLLFSKKSKQSQTEDNS